MNTDLIVSTKKCTKCGEVKNLASFRIRHKGLLKRTSWCGKCTDADKQMRRIHRQLVGLCRCGKPPSPGRKQCCNCRFRKSKVRPEQVVRLKDAQKNKCAMCGDPEPNHIDHDHKTGKIRGILCGQCNSLLGFAKEEVRRLQKGLAYLRFHKKLIHHPSNSRLYQVYPQGGLDLSEINAALGSKSDYVCIGPGR